MQNHETKLQALKAFHHLIAESEDEVDALTPEQVDAELKQYGVDVKPVMATLQAAVKQLKARRKLDAARDERTAQLQALHERVPDDADSPNDEARCRELLAACAQVSPQQAAVLYRKFENGSGEDWKSLRADLEYLLKSKSKPKP